MSLGKLWAGRAYGTNAGNLFVEIDGDDANLHGTLRLNELGVGIVIYEISGSYRASELHLTGNSKTKIAGFNFGELTAKAKLNERGELEGLWETSIGSAGTFTLFPHQQSVSQDNQQEIPQLHSARYDFNAIQIGRNDLTALAENIQAELTKGIVIVTSNTGTEQSMVLADFKKTDSYKKIASYIKIFSQEKEPSGLNRSITIEFGPQVNFATIQGSNEAWVLGKLETLKRQIRTFESGYATNIKRAGVGINQILFVSALILLPGLGIQSRAVLMISIIAIGLSINWLHRRYLPHARIMLSPLPPSALVRAWPSILSWLIALTASILAAVIAAYLQGWLKIPPVPAN